MGWVAEPRCGCGGIVVVRDVDGGGYGGNGYGGVGCSVNEKDKGGVGAGDDAHGGDGDEVVYASYEGSDGGDVDVTVVAMATVVAATANKGGGAWRRWVVELIDRDTGSHFGVRRKRSPKKFFGGGGGRRWWWLTGGRRLPEMMGEMERFVCFYKL
nr:hypothetical protein [Tanacetum cinerariifolium]